MAWHTTHSITALNAKGTNSVYKLQQQLDSAPTVKKLAIIKEPEVNFSFSTDYGEGVLSMWTTISLVNNFDGDIISEFLANPETDFRLLIEINGTELFRGTLDFKWNEEEILPSAATMFEFEATFANGFHSSDEKNIDEILNAIKDSGNSEHAYNIGTSEGHVPMADLWGEFIFQNICGYDSDDIIVSHDWLAENWAFNDIGVAQMRELYINPLISSDLENRSEWYKALCRGFTMHAGYSWKLGKPLLQDLRKGASGDYTGDRLTKVSDGFRTDNGSVDIEELDSLKIISEQKPKRIFKKANSAIDALDINSVRKYYCTSSLDTYVSNEELEITVVFDPLNKANNGSGGVTNGMSVRSLSGLTNTGNFKGHYSTAPSQYHNIWKANAIALASCSKMIVTYDYQVKLNDLIDPMIPIKIETERYRACVGSLQTISMTSLIEKSVLISEDYTNVLVSSGTS